MPNLDEIKGRREKWEEEWKNIPGIDGYEVSDFGNVRSFYQKGNFKRKLAPYPKALAGSKTGPYKTVCLKIGKGKHKTFTVHRLVMLAFVGECPSGHEVAHLNGNGADNRLCNLRYVTHVENEKHKHGHGTFVYGEKVGTSVLQNWQVAEIKYLASKSVSQGKIAKLFDISHKQVSEILRGRSWKNIPARHDGRNNNFTCTGAPQ